MPSLAAPHRMRIQPYMALQRAVGAQSLTLPCCAAPPPTLMQRLPRLAVPIMSPQPLTLPGLPLPLSLWCSAFFGWLGAFLGGAKVLMGTARVLIGGWLAMGIVSHGLSVIVSLCHNLGPPHSCFERLAGHGQAASVVALFWQPAFCVWCKFECNPNWGGVWP